MTRRILRVLPPILVVVGAAAFVFYLVSGISRSLTLKELDPLFTVAFGLFLPLGAFIARRRPTNAIGWLMVAIGLSVLVSSAATEYATRALVVDPGSLPAGPELAFLSEILGLPGLLLMSFLMLLFPTGHLPSRRWRWVALVAGANALLILAALVSTWPVRGRLLLAEEPPDGLLFPVAVFEVGWLILMASAAAGTFSLVVRFGRSSGDERQQLKWMAYVVAVVGVLVVLNFFVLDPLGASPLAADVAEQILNLAVVGIPVAAAIAISRYRLYEIDVVINRTLVYGALTAILVGIYLGLVFGFQALLAPITEQSDLAVAASTLAVAALFRPVRGRLQDFIDRRFYRRKFDAQKTVEDFGAHLRDEVELDSLTHRFVSAVQDTMQPAHVSLWLRKEAGS